ncbi:hypothetical protein [Gillisia limnaea]|uniref:Sugar transferase n=1 Tax=Gillisia limnaea (strain DSM 15749 / LMG 21470 / R-8282) TaxID=865937 RepID=H2BZZ8_GILLR|nr:hypothetical protein [Gillisia limnaea]EHQ02365.1 hypothetical protein Gilli_1722 [Gillisia limnaea DSM 15749]
MLAPICLFTYNRLGETKQTVKALQNNFLAKESDLFIFSDGPKNEAASNKVNVVREYLKTIKGFKSITIFKSQTNKGLANSIISGVTQIIKQYGKVIVLEDDLITTPNFLDFMNHALEFYENDEKIKSISGYSTKILQKCRNIDIHFQRRAHSWGWASWKSRWDINVFRNKNLKLDNDKLREFRITCGDDIDNMLISSINGKIDSWYVWWVYDHFIKNKFTVYPIYSKIKNIGFSDESTHCQGISVFEIELDTFSKRNFNFTPLVQNPKLEKQFLNYYKMSYKLFYRLKLLNSLKGIKMVVKEIQFRIFKIK